MPVNTTPESRAAALKSVDVDEVQAFREICISHELSERDVVQQDEPIVSIEMFLFNLPKLWLNENEIQAIQGLDLCLQLRRLYLYSNRITAIQGLGALQKLEVLWLADNQISYIAGLSQLTALQELNLARNSIEVVSDTLGANTALHTLNLADNRLGSFKQVWHLASLPNLEQLLFSDPDWGASPIARLCNYATYAAVNLPNLRSLDIQLLRAETKAVAEATYLKKKMYYNMRISTLKRKTAALAHQAQHGLKAQLAPLQHALRKLQYESKAVAAELEQFSTAASLTTGGGTRVQQMQHKAQALQQCIDEKLQQVARQEMELAAACKASDRVTQGLVHRMLMELETGGNIRFEEGKVGDQWLATCSQLLEARWQQPTGLGYRHLGSQHPVLQRLTRVHNRFLRSRLESKLDELKLASTQSGDRHLLEYLFFCSDPAHLQRLAEEGFPQPPSQPLSNSLTMALQTGPPGTAMQAGPAEQTRHVMVAKVLMSHCCKAGLAGDIDDSHYPGCSAVYQTPGEDPKQRWWHVLNNAFILPEYIAEVCFSRLAGSDATHTHPPPTETLASELPHIAAPLIPFLTFCPTQDLSGLTDTHLSPHQDLGGSPSPQQSHINTLVAQESQLCAESAAALALPPVLQPRHRMYQLSEKGILEMTGVSLLGMLTQLNLHGSALKRIEGLEGAVGLRSLVLTFNELTSMEGLPSLTRLTCLDLSFNAISRIQALKGLSALRHVDLQGNQLSRLEDLNLLRKYVCCLTHLDLRGNPLARAPSYTPLTLRRLPHLATLDGKLLGGEDWEHAVASHGLLTVPMLELCASTRLLSIWSTPDGQVGPKPAAWWGRVVELRMADHGLRRIQGLEQLTGLRKACFAHNEISHIQGLEACTALQELSFEGNSIAHMDSLSHLSALLSLDLSCNRIMKVNHLSSLTLLRHLAVHGNQITSLAGLSCLVSLMELSCGGNNVGGVREVGHLRGLLKLIILDLTGNPIATQDDYRLYTIYHLRKLKVLDGVTVEAGEQAASRNLYAGRLTLDSLVERVGHSHFERLREMDLSGMGLKELGDVFTKEEGHFSGIQMLTLDNNELTEISGFSSFTSLAVLSMGSNRLGEAASFELPSLAGLLRADAGNGPDTAKGTLQVPHKSVMFPKLQVLRLQDNSIRNIQGLQLYGFTGLRSIDLHGNKLTRVDGLQTLHSLRELILDHNILKCLDPSCFASVPRLRRLHLGHNGLRSLAHLSSLTRLQFLHFGANRITEVTELDRLTNLASLTEVWLVDNLVAKKQWYRALLLSKCRQLKVIDGQLVTREERSFVDSVLLAEDPVADGASFGDEAAAASEPQRTVKINQLSFNEHGDGNIGWSGRPLLAPKPKAADPLSGPSRTSSGSVLPIVRPAIWSRFGVTSYSRQAAGVPEVPKGEVRRGSASRQGSRILQEATEAAVRSFVPVKASNWDVMTHLGRPPGGIRRATQ
ncbi:TPA: Leucine-rich repeat-containing protein 9 [Trebouxia sp. C0004]